MTANSGDQASDDQVVESTLPAAADATPILASNAKGFRYSLENFAAGVDQRLSPERRREEAARQLDDARSHRRRGAHIQHALYDSRDTTEAGRMAAWLRFEHQVDPELPADERQRRAAAARRAWFVELGRRGRQAQFRRRGSNGARS